MKYFDDLTEKQQGAAVQYCLNDLLVGIVEGAIRFDDEKNGDDLQARIDDAFARAELAMTPWFAHEYIMEVARDELVAMARADAAATVYLEEDDAPIVYLSAIDKMANSLNG
jgi:hypothetical protein